MRFRAWLVIVGLLPLTFSSCVFSVQPLSDDTNSFLDEQLIGYWEEKGSNPKKRFFIGRKPDTKNTLVWVFLPQLTDEGFIDGSAAITMNVRKGKFGNYLSLEHKDKKTNKSLYLICKYDIPDKNKYRLFCANEEFFTAAVMRGELKGHTGVAEYKVTGTDPNDTKEAESQKRDVLLSDTPDRIFNFLEKHGSKCFDKEPTVYLRYRVTD